MFKKKIITACASALLVLGLAACGGNEEETTVDQSENKAVATVNGEAISEHQLTFQYEQMKVSYQQMGLEITEETEAQIKMHVLDQLVNSTLITQAAIEEGFGASEDEVQAQLNLFIEEYGTEEQFIEVLEENQFTLATFTNEIKSQLTINKYLENKLETPVISMEEIEARYEEYKQQSPDIPELETIQAQLEQEIKQEKNQQLVGELVDRLKENSEINIHI